jgi:hypothetical protein
MDRTGYEYLRFIQFSHQILERKLPFMRVHIIEAFEQNEAAWPRQIAYMQSAHLFIGKRDSRVRA